MDKRKPRFTDQIEKNYSMLQRKLTDAVTSQKKNDTWETISAKVNASGASHRTANDVKKMWEDLKTHCKRRAVEVEKDMALTGGGKRVKKDLTELESRVVSLLCKERLHGIDGGLDIGNANEVSNHALIVNFDRHCVF